MLPDRQQIESALGRLRSGELSTAEATELLLEPTAPIRSGAAGRPSGEPLRSLIDRLGSPPAGIVDSWCEQLHGLAAAHETATREPLPPVNLNELIVDRRGQLIWSRLSVSIAIDAEATPQMQTSLEHLDQFRCALIAEPGIEGERQGDDLSDPPARSQKPLFSPAQHSRDEPAEVSNATPVRDPLTLGDRIAQKPKSLVRRVVTASFVIATLAAIVAVLVIVLNQRGNPNARSDSELARSPVQDDTGSRRTGLLVGDRDITSPPIPSASSSPGGEQESLFPGNGPFAITHSEDLAPIEMGELERFESIDESAAETTGSGIFDAEDLSLGALMPAAESFLPNVSGAPGGPPREEETPTVEGAERADEVSDAAMDVIGPEQEEQKSPDESPQPIRLSTVTAIELPPLGEPDVSALLWEESSNPLDLEFPFAVPISISASDTGWQIHDSRNDLVVATIGSDADGTALSWTDSATKSPVASALLHGRVTDALDRLVYLRPTIEADPWPLRLDRTDVRPTWDLRQPIPPRVARISIQCELPEGIELGWIEPLDPTAIRRARAVAVFNLTDSETVSLGLRFDIRCGRKLSCRIRFAARLGSAMPWQMVSRTSLDQFVESLADQTDRVKRESLRLAAVDNADSPERRRMLRSRRDQVDSLVDALRRQSQRTAELQSLIAMLEANAVLRIRVWVEWSDDDQTILQMGPP